jgi:hypothetical protein
VLDPATLMSAHYVAKGTTMRAHTADLFRAGCSGPYVDPDAKLPAVATTTTTTTTTASTMMSQPDQDHPDEPPPAAVCGQTKENWLCLSCGVVRCSRYQHGHCRHHYDDTLQHAVHASLSDLSVWCHTCQKYLSTHTGSTGLVLRDLIVALEEAKHGPITTTTTTAGDE